MNLRQKRDLNLMNRVIPVKKTIKDWLYHAGMQFIKTRQLTDEEEVFMEELCDFYVQNVDNIEDIERRINEEINSNSNIDALTAALWTDNYAKSRESN